jgi:chemotaxis protein methyltransferase CheR
VIDPATRPFPPVVTLLQALVEDRLGLRYGDGDLPSLIERIGARAAAAGCDSLVEYHHRLREADDPEEWSALADHLVVGETHLFRELPSLRALVDQEIVPRTRRQSPVRVWSAGCSTGEEPLTLAVLLAELHCLDQVDLCASDVSVAALARARTGCFPSYALRLPALPDIARRWMSQLPDGSIQVSPDLVAHVRWHPINLLEPGPVRALGAFDAIVCRNVFIYLGERATRVVMAHLTEALRPGGVLLVGVSESLHRFAPALTCEEHDGTFYYRKGE